MNKKIGILTSGGDCGGLNAAIRSIFYRAKNKYKMDVYGIRDGTAGLIKRPVDVMQLTHKTFGGYLLRQGGTFLGSTNKGNPFKIPTSNGKHVDKSKEIIEGYHSMKLDGLIIIGGDGSMQILKKLAKDGDMKIVAIPKTIDNDVGATESSLGFHTAVDVATQALDNLQSTAASHRRSMILEVMGRDAGHIALNAGIAGGADIILIPELKYSIDGIINKLNSMKKNDIQHSLIIVAEAVKKADGSRVVHKYMDGEQRLGGIGDYIAQELMKKTDAVIGGEGNGGVIYPNLHYGRDALVGIALFLSHLCHSDCSVSILRSQYPNWLMRKDKVVLSQQHDVDALLDSIASAHAAFQVTTIDGVKIDLPDGWVHIRKSNTEPIIRIYAEAKTEKRLDELVGEIQRLVKE